MSNAILTKEYVAAVDIKPHRIVTWAGDGKVRPAVYGDLCIGVSREPGANAGQSIGVDRLGISEVKIAGGVVAGQPITVGSGLGSDDGRGIPATGPGVGRAETSGKNGDIIKVFVLPMVM